MKAVWWTCDQEYLRQCRATLSELKQHVTEGRSQITLSVVAVADSYAMLDRSLETRPQLGALVQARLARAPWCPACHKPMHLESAKPDKAYAKLRHVIFVCSCGRRSDQFVAISD